jgi:dihydropteroate synthase
MRELRRPVYVGVSRKSFIAKLTGAEDPSDRLGGSIAAAVLAVANGASMVRAHDVFETVQAVRLTERVVEKAQGTNAKEGQ